MLVMKSKLLLKVFEEYASSIDGAANKFNALEGKILYQANKAVSVLAPCGV